MAMFISGIVLGALAIIGIIFIFAFLIKKQERLKKLPVWVYVLAPILLVMGLAAIGLVIAGGLTK